MAGGASVTSIGDKSGWAQKKRATARFPLFPRLLRAAGTFMVGEPSIGSNTIAAEGNLTSYLEGYFWPQQAIWRFMTRQCVHMKAGRDRGRQGGYDGETSRLGRVAGKIVE